MAESPERKTSQSSSDHKVHRRGASVGTKELLLLAMVAFPLGALSGVAVDRMDVLSSLMDRAESDVVAADSPASHEKSLTLELLDFEESQYVMRRDAYQANYAFDQGSTAAQLQTISDVARRDVLRSLLPGAHQTDVRDLQIVELEPGPGYRLQRVSFTNANGLTVRGILSTPTTGQGPYPVVVIPTGTNATGYDLFSIPERDYHNDVGRRFSGEYVVFGLDLPNMEEDAFLMANAAGHGDNYSYYVTCDKISSALDLALGQPSADRGRVGIYGISAGGYAAILGGICDERIGAIAASGTNVFTSKSSDLLRIRRFETAFLYRYAIAEFPDLHQAMYGLFPRPVIMEIDMHDTSGVYTEALANTQRVLDYYNLRNQSAIAYRVIIEDDTCRSAWRNHCMEVTRVKQAFDALFRKM